ncbi:MAG: transcription antitermination factor NusB [Anaerolineae bacterium]|jgi:N utilization substance protein B|nr:transcription antitermination factor NusB [Anaerolineae bacterium]
MTLPIPELGDLGPDDEVSVEEIPHTPMQHDHSIARALALQALYELDLTGHPTGEVLNAVIQRMDGALNDDITDYIRTLVQGVQRFRPAIDSAIQLFAPEFPVKHLAAIDRCTLRLAVFEHSMAALVPVSVAIDEAVSLARQYGADASPRFVNGVLGNLMEDANLLARLRATYDNAQGEG